MKPSWSKLTVALGTAFAMTACTAEIPEHSHPEPEWPKYEQKPAAKVESFSVEPAVIKKGEKATISWKVTDAITVAIKDSDGKGVDGVEANALSGSVEVAPTETTGYILSAIGEAGNDFGIIELRVSPEEVVIPEAPLLLAAVPSEIKAGEEAYLVWNGPGPVSITDEDGNPIDTQGQRSGSVRLPTVVKTTEYLARAGTQETTATLVVKPSIGRFIANPAGAVAGQPVTLSWSTGGADSVVLSERTRGELYVARQNELSEGSFEDTIPEGLPIGSVLVYTLTVTNNSGVETRELQFLVSNTPTITEFKLDRDVLTKGFDTRPKLSWKTSNAVRISIYATEERGPTTLIYKSPSTIAAGSGSYTVALPTDGSVEEVVYELLAEAEQGGQSRETVTLSLVEPPVINTFEATPPAITNGGGSAALTWTTTGGSLLVITNQDGAAVGSSRSQGFIDAGTLPVNPGGSTTYTLTLTNAAGDSVTEEATVEVENPLLLDVNPPIAVLGEDVAISWDFSSIATSVVGAPISPEVRGFDEFIDISESDDATEILSPSSTSSSSATIVFPDAFKFRYYGIQYDRVYVSSQGWIGFGTQSSSSAPSGEIPTTSSPNNFIAPFAVSQGYGKVYWELRGTAPDRKLIIQWKGMKTGSSDGSNYNYEVILNESGQVDFLYDLMEKGNPTTENNKRIGLENLDGSDGIAATFHGDDPKSIPQQNDHVTFFGPAPATGSAIVKSTGSQTYEIRLALTNGGITTATGSIGVPSVGDVKISEVMFKPIAPEGQWIEIQNTANYAIDSGDLTIVTNGGAVELPSAASGDGAILQPGEYKVIGLTKDRSTNGDTPVDIVAPIGINSTGDTIKLLFRSNLEMSQYIFSDTNDAHPAGASQFNNGFVCAATTGYGIGSHLGSPGAPNTDPCGYEITEIPPNYVDIHTTGTVLMSNDFWVRRQFAFPDGFVFPFEGVDRTAVVVNVGWLNFDTTFDDTVYAENLAPSTFPSTTETYALGGVIAPFWDGSANQTNGGVFGYYYQYFDPDNDPSTKDGYLIIQWHNINLPGETNPTASVNFQAWLWEDGTIDFQYGDMIEGGGSITDRAQGSRAAVGIAVEDGSAGSVYSFKEPKIQSNMGLRFKRH